MSLTTLNMYVRSIKYSRFTIASMSVTTGYTKQTCTDFKNSASKDVHACSAFK